MLETFSDRKEKYLGCINTANRRMLEFLSKTITLTGKREKNS
jgi:hypothetical protein